ncbi:Hypothetical protein NocV09_03500040 [Nannochloropsis oceanica]
MRPSFCFLLLASAMLSVGTAGAESASYLRGLEAAKQPPAPVVNGEKLKMLIDCFASYMQDASYRPDNSQLNGCWDYEIIHCRTDSGQHDHFCLFNGTNHLQDLGELSAEEKPKCWFNCQMETCDAWDVPHTTEQEECVDDL